MQVLHSALYTPQMGSFGWKVTGVVSSVVLAAVLIGFYVSGYLVGNTKTFVPPAQASQPRVVDLTLETVAAVGPTLAPKADWVSYLIRDGAGHWRRSTVWRLPANGIVHVTIYNFDGASGLRNPLLGQPQGLVGDMLVDGKPVKVLPPDQPSHTFAVPELGILVPIAPVPDDAKNTCEYAPCALSSTHRTITFTFRTGKRGHYRWQCFVPCAAGYLYGFGGPMQSIGYMDGFLDVV